MFCILIVLSQILLIKKLFFLLTALLFTFLYSFRIFRGLIQTSILAIFLLVSLIVINSENSKIHDLRELLNKSEGDIELTVTNLNGIKGIVPGLYGARSKVSLNSGQRFSSKMLFSEKLILGDEKCEQALVCEITRDRLGHPESLLDYAKYFSNGISTEVNLIFSEEHDVDCRCDEQFALSEEENSFKIIKKLRDFTISDKVSLQIGSALALGAIFGEGQYLPEWLQELFKQTGMYHLLVISGYHLSILLGFTTIVLFRLLYLYPNILNHITRKKLELICGGAICSLFLCYINVYLPLWRAILALITAIFCACLNLEISKSRFMVLTLILMQIFWPLSILTPSLQLTYASLIGVILGFEISKNKFDESFLSQLILPNLFAFFATAPLMYFWFGGLSSYSIIFNVLFGQLFTLFVVIIGIISCLYASLGFPFWENLLQANFYLSYNLILIIEYINNLISG